MKGNLPGHGPLLHGFASVRGPTQSEPLLIGGGLVQLRNRTWMPGPHEVLQGPNGLHSVKAPSTENKKMIKRLL